MKTPNGKKNPKKQKNMVTERNTNLIRKEMPPVPKRTKQPALMKKEPVNIGK